MRFLIGIITGAILTLLFATVMDAPTHPMLDRTRNAAAAIWDTVISSTSDSLFTENDPAVKTVIKTVMNPPAAQSIDESLPPSTARAPATGLPAPRSMDEPPPAVVKRPQIATSTVVQSPPAEVRAPAVETLAAVADPVDPANAEGDTAEAPVWVPFHSLMSAEGFAARLARELNHDFQVERQGAGTYQVVFEASDPAQRAALLAQISEITGQ